MMVIVAVVVVGVARVFIVQITLLTNYLKTYPLSTHKGVGGKKEGIYI